MFVSCFLTGIRTTCTAKTTFHYRFLPVVSMVPLMITHLLIRIKLLQPHQFVSNVMIATNQWRTATPAQTTCVKSA